MSPDSPRGDREGRLLPGVPAWHGAAAEDAALYPLSCSGEDTAEGHWVTSSRAWLLSGHPAPPLLWAQEQQNLSVPSQNQPYKAFPGRARHERKHLPPSTVKREKP